MGKHLSGARRLEEETHKDLDLSPAIFSIADEYIIAKSRFEQSPGWKRDLVCLASLALAVIALSKHKPTCPKTCEDLRIPAIPLCQHQ